MPLIPNLIESLVFLQFHLAPAPMLDVFAAIGQRVVMAALNLGVFEALDKAPQTADDVAQKIHANPVGVAQLLETLVGLGYVRKRGSQYSNTTITSKWLVSSAKVNLTPYYQYWGAILPTLFNNLEESLRTGTAPVNLYEWIENQPEVSGYFQEGMVALAAFALPDLLKIAQLPASAKTLLDIGGGHGSYTVGFCQHYPDLQATIFDSPRALVTARETIAQYGLENRVRLQEGNFVTDDLGSGYDAALVLNIVHGFDVDMNTALLRKTLAALNPGGCVIIMEQLAGQAPLPLAKTINNLLGLAYYHLLDGKMYCYEDVAAWLHTAGFSHVTHKVMAMVGSSIVMATKP